MSDILSTIKTLNNELKNLMDNQGNEMSNIAELLKQTTDVTNEFDDMWVGAWGQNNFDIYWDYDKAREIKANTKYFLSIIDKKCKINLVSLDSKITDNLKLFKKYQQKIIIELSLIRDQEKFSNENDLLNKIENFQWGLETSAYVKLKQPNQIAIYDYDILSRGIEAPPHIAATGYAVSLFTKTTSIKLFDELANRILRQIELKLDFKETQQNSNYISTVLEDIFENFHSFCRQLRNRYGSRPTIDISDEYDVQDLLHSILKLHFKDVREEEYTPSYAGSSTRMDFLLKDESIVIEVKKTRDRLLDKEVGEQLILDVAHYKNHPNCKFLKCFVYDPENRIKNPRGLENDIKKLSDNDMSVELFVRP